MDNLGDVFGGLGDMLGDMFGGDPGPEGALGLAEIFAPEGRRREMQAPVAYVRYLCGGLRELNINDR